jgi:hypothetical protein
VDVMSLTCRPAVVPQDDLGAPASPSRTRSADPIIMGETLTDDARTATPPRGEVESRATSLPMAGSGVESLPCAVEVGGAYGGDVRATTSPTIVDIDPISAVPGGAKELVRDQPQIDQELGGPKTSGAQVPRTSSSSPRLPRWEINWNRTPWQDDWFEDNEDMQALRTSIVTINTALMMSLSTTCCCYLIVRG